jgi:hypothetical protein
MAHRHRVHRRAAGGRMEYTKDSNVQREAGRDVDDFRRGGKPKHHGLKAHGLKPRARADKRARGGSVTHSPFSSAARGNDAGRHSKDKDGHQPYAHGGRVKRHAGIGHHAEGGKTRPSPFAKHEYNYGHHHGSGHEEPLEHHLPVHHKHGGTPKHHATGGKAHHAGHGAHHAHHPGHDGIHHGHHTTGGHHMHGKAPGRKHRAHGGKVDDDGDGPGCEQYCRGGRAEGGRLKSSAKKTESTRFSSLPEKSETAKLAESMKGRVSKYTPEQHSEIRRKMEERRKDRERRRSEGFEDIISPEDVKRLFGGSNHEFSRGGRKHRADGGRTDDDESPHGKLRSDLTPEQRERALKIGRIGYKSAGAQRKRTPEPSSSVRSPEKAAGGPIKVSAKHADIYETSGGTHHWTDAGDKSKMRRGGR